MGRGYHHLDIVVRPLAILLVAPLIMKSFTASRRVLAERRNVALGTLHIAVVILGLVTCPVRADVADLTYSVAMEEPVYQLGDTLFVLITATNTGDTPAYLTWPTYLQAYYVMDDYDMRYHMAVIPDRTYLTIEPHAAFTWRKQHYPTYYVPGPGEHTVQGFVDGYGGSSTETFTIVPEPDGAAIIGMLWLGIGRRKRRRCRAFEKVLIPFSVSQALFLGANDRVRLRFRPAIRLLWSGKLDIEYERHDCRFSRMSLSVRVATLDHLPFIDDLQKKQTRQVGFMPRQSLEGKLSAGHVLVAEEPSPLPSPGLPGEGERRVGYVIGTDRYFKRDDCGIIYQLNVIPEMRRSLVGATLVKAVFDRAAYGCRLFCCWCAQDMEANHFWESLGFVPLAFRTGSRDKGRVHIFWQRRIRAGDSTTPYWFPSQTTSGSIREDRLVFPIPPGVHWSDEMPRVLPLEANPKLETRDPKQIRSTKSKIRNQRPANAPPGGLWFAVSKPRASDRLVKREPKARPKTKNDPRLVSAARELRDRWLERANTDPSALVPTGKYDLSRAVPDARLRNTGTLTGPLLEAA